MLWAEHVARNTAGARDDVFAEVKPHFTDAELVELTGICGLFAVSNRFQDSMRLPIEEQGEVDKIRQSVRADPQRLKAYVARLIQDWPETLPSFPTAFPESEGSFVPPSRWGRGIAGEGGSWPSLHKSWLASAALKEVAHCRVPLLDPAWVTGDAACFFAAAKQLLDGVPNAVRVWGHVPHVGKLVLPFLAAIERAAEGEGGLSAALRILVICRTSHINSARYTLAHAAAMAHAAGIDEDQFAELASVRCVSSASFSDRERAALVWAEHVAQNTAKHHDPVFAELKRHYSDAQIVELTALCASTNMVNRIHNALRVPVEAAEDIVALYRASRIDAARLKAYLESVVADWPQTLPVPDTCG